MEPVGLLRAEQLLQEHRVEDAQKLLSKIVGSTTIDDEGHLDALGLLARCHIILRQTERAIAVLDNIVETVDHKSDCELTVAYATTWSVRAALHAFCGRRRDAFRDAVRAFQNGNGEYKDEQAALAWGKDFVAQLQADASELDQDRQNSPYAEITESESGSILRRMNSLFSLATQRMDEEDYTEAEKSLSEALSLGAHVDSEVAAACRSTRAFCRIMDGQFEAAMVDFTAVLESAHRSHSAGDVAESSAIVCSTLVARSVLHRIMNNVQASDADIKAAADLGGCQADKQVKDLFDAWTVFPRVRQAMQISTSSEILAKPAAEVSIIPTEVRVHGTKFDLSEREIQMIQATYRRFVKRQRYLRILHACRVIQRSARKLLAKRYPFEHTVGTVAAGGGSFPTDLADLKHELTRERSARYECQSRISQLQAELERLSNPADGNAEMLLQEVQTKDEQLKRAAELGQSLLLRNDALQCENADLRAERDQFANANEEHEYRVSELSLDVAKLQDKIRSKDAKLLESERTVLHQAEQLAELERSYERMKTRIETMQESDAGNDTDNDTNDDIQVTCQNGLPNFNDARREQIDHLNEEATAWQGREREARLAQAMTEEARIEAQRQIRQLEQRIQSAEQIICEQEAKSAELADSLARAQNRGEREHACMLEEKQRAEQIVLQLEEAQHKLHLATTTDARAELSCTPVCVSYADVDAEETADVVCETPASGTAEYRSLLDEISSFSPSKSNPSAPRSLNSAYQFDASNSISQSGRDILARECVNLKVALSAAIASRDAVVSDRDRRQLLHERRELLASRKQAELLSQLQQIRRDKNQLSESCENLRKYVQKQESELRQQKLELQHTRCRVAALSQAQNADIRQQIFSKVANGSNWEDPLLIQAGNPAPEESADSNARDYRNDTTVLPSSRISATAAWRDSLFHTAAAAMGSERENYHVNPAETVHQAQPVVRNAVIDAVASTISNETHQPERLRKPGWGLLGRRATSQRRGGGQQPMKYKVLDTATVRKGFGRKSEKVGVLETGEVVTVLEARQNEDGQTRLRCEWNGASTYWTSMVAVDGTPLLEPMHLPLERSDPLKHDSDTTGPLVPKLAVAEPPQQLAQICKATRNGRISPAMSQPVSPLAPPANNNSFSGEIPTSTSLPNLAAQQNHVLGRAVPLRLGHKGYGQQPPCSDVHVSSTSLHCTMNVHAQSYGLSSQHGHQKQQHNFYAPTHSAHSAQVPSRSNGLEKMGIKQMPQLLRVPQDHPIRHSQAVSTEEEEDDLISL